MDGKSQFHMFLYLISRKKKLSPTDFNQQAKKSNIEYIDIK